MPFFYTFGWLGLRDSTILPQSFPTHSHLAMVECDAECVVNCPPKEIFQEALKNWTRFEDMVDATSNLDLTTHFFQSCTYKNLKRLNVSFQGVIQSKVDIGADNFRRHDKLKEFLQHIGSASQLEDLSVAGSPIELANTENLHTKLPNLKLLKLTVDLNNNPNNESEERLLSGIDTVAGSIKKLELHLHRVNHGRQ